MGYVFRKKPIPEIGTIFALVQGVSSVHHM